MSTKRDLWVPSVPTHYAPILDHGYRPVTRGVVLHVNAGWQGRIARNGTEDYFTNGRPLPVGSEGVGAHFEVGGAGINGRPSDSEYADNGSLQFVPLDRVTWHAVAANSFAIGIEHAGWGESRDAWLKLHYNLIGRSAYITAWILHRFNLGPPVVSLDDPNHGNVWPHSCGSWSWGGHSQCPGEHFPWDIWTPWAKKAYHENWNWR